jgi:hypothetical protein
MNNGVIHNHVFKISDYNVLSSDYFAVVVCVCVSDCGRTEGRLFMSK